jgi:hypothetical protein
VDDAVASHAAVEMLVNKFRNTIALPQATRSSDARHHCRPRDPRRNLRAASATESQLDGARALFSMPIDASTFSDPPIPDGTPTPSSTASTAAATVPADSATLAFELASAEANTLAKQSTETWPLVNVPTVLKYDTSHYCQWRRWSHNQAALHDCVAALTNKTPRLHLSSAKSRAIRSET